MELFIFRLLAGLFSLSLGEGLSLTTLIAVVFSMSISHNLLAFVYSKSQRGYLKQNWRSHVFPLATVTVLLLLVSVFDWPHVYFLFAIHHVCNETYFAQKRFGRDDSSTILPRTLLITLTFLIITRVELERFGFALPINVWAGMLVVSMAFFLTMVLRSGAASKIKDVTYEIVGPAFAIYSLATHSATLDYILVYHFVFWTMYPVKMLAKQKALTSYFVATVLLFGVAALFTTLGPHWGSLDDDQLSYISRITSFFHFFSSMALSQLHPQWITRWFFGIRGEGR